MVENSHYLSTHYFKIIEGSANARWRLLTNNFGGLDRTPMKADSEADGELVFGTGTLRGIGDICYGQLTFSEPLPRSFYMSIVIPQTEPPAFFGVQTDIAFGDPETDLPRITETRKLSSIFSSRIIFLPIDPDLKMVAKYPYESRAFQNLNKFLMAKKGRANRTIVVPDAEIDELRQVLNQFKTKKGVFNLCTL